MKKLFKMICPLIHKGNTIIFTIIFSYTAVNAQNKISYNIFDRAPLGQLQIILPAPQATILSPTNISLRPNQTLDYNNSIEQQNHQLIRQQSLLEQIPDAKRAEIMEGIKQDVEDFVNPKHSAEEMEWLAKTQSYRQAYNDLTQLNPDNFSITKAVFTIENAYFDNKLSYSQLTTALQQRANLVKQILKREGLSSKNNLALNYGVQKLYSQQNSFYSSKYKYSVLVPPLKYDFNDFRGEKDYSKMFVSKLLATGKGQCHAMPLLYLMIAEQLGAKAELSLAPQHSFIQFKDNNGIMMNFETTHGNIASNTWLMQSGFITSKALQEKTYLDTLSQRKLYAQVLSDLLLGYISKFPYDDFAEQIRQKILQVNPDNTTALIVDANIKTQIALQKIKAAGSPKENDLPNYPDAYKAYQQMMDAHARVDETGYQDMPKDEYQKWLKSMEQEKQKQASKEMQQKLQREIQHLKNLKATFKNNVKS